MSKYRLKDKALQKRLDKATGGNFSHRLQDNDFVERMEIGGPNAAVTLLLVAFIPSGKTLAAMYVIPPIVNSSAVQELPSELVEVAREWLDELRPNRGNNK